MKAKRKYVEKLDFPLDKENHTLSFLFEQVAGGYKCLIIETYYYTHTGKFSYRGPKAIYGIEFMTMNTPDEVEEKLRDYSTNDLYEKYKEKDYKFFEPIFKVEV